MESDSHVATTLKCQEQLVLLLQPERLLTTLLHQAAAGNAIAAKMYARRLGVPRWRSDRLMFSALNIECASSTRVRSDAGITSTRSHVRLTNPESLRASLVNEWKDNHEACVQKTKIDGSFRARLDTKTENMDPQSLFSEEEMTSSSGDDQSSREFAMPGGFVGSASDIREYLLSFRSVPRSTSENDTSCPTEFQSLVVLESCAMQASEAVIETPAAFALTRAPVQPLTTPTLSATRREVKQSAFPDASPTSYTAAKRVCTTPNRSRVEEIRRMVKSLLNKICPENVGSIASKIGAVEISSANDLEIVIGLIFAKALAEPHYCETYADLALILKSTFPDFPSPDGARPITFKSSLLNVCQKEFECIPTTIDMSEKEKEAMDPEEFEFLRKKNKDRMLANMKLVGHLFLRQLLSAKVIGAVIRELLLCSPGAAEDAEVKHLRPVEHAVECACELLMATGYTLESLPRGKVAMVDICGRLRELKLAKTADGKAEYSKRIQFLIQDLIETRSAGWAKKELKSKAKTIDEIRLDQQRELTGNAKTPVANCVIVGQRPSYLCPRSGA